MRDRKTPFPIYKIQTLNTLKSWISFNWLSNYLAQISLAEVINNNINIDYPLLRVNLAVVFVVYPAV